MICSALQCLRLVGHPPTDSGCGKRLRAQNPRRRSPLLPGRSVRSNSSLACRHYHRPTVSLNDVYMDIFWRYGHIWDIFWIIWHFSCPKSVYTYIVQWRHRSSSFGPTIEWSVLGKKQPSRWEYFKLKNSFGFFKKIIRKVAPFPYPDD